MESLPTSDVTCEPYHKPLFIRAASVLLRREVVIDIVAAAI
jgi:hypothetical protein